MRMDGSDVRRITDDKSEDGRVRQSPSDGRIAFV